MHQSWTQLNHTAASLFYHLQDDRAIFQRTYEEYRNMGNLSHRITSGIHFAIQWWLQFSVGKRNIVVLCDSIGFAIAWSSVVYYNAIADPAIHTVCLHYTINTAPNDSLRLILDRIPIDIFLLHAVFRFWSAEFQNVVLHELKGYFNENAPALCTHIFSEIVLNYETSGVLAIW